MSIVRIACLLCCLPRVALAAPWLRSEGVATTPGGEVAYREVHWQREALEGAERWVLYQCPDGQPFARKYLPASARPQARGYSLEDRRSGQQARIEVASGTVLIDWKEDGTTPPRQRRLELPAEAVIDAGFDAAVRLHWAALLRGERVVLPFLAPGRQRFYLVQVRRGGPLRWQGIAAQSFQVSLDAWYGSLAPRLSLVYAEADRRLLEFHGTSNLRDPRGDYPQVTIRFGKAPALGSAGEWQQAWRESLVSRCTPASG